MAWTPPHCAWGIEINNERNWVAAADVVVVDPDRVAARATFQDPHQYPDGINYVVVNGVVAVDDGVFRDERAGVILRK